MTPRSRISRIVIALACLLAGTIVGAPPAHAAPPNEGGSKSLREQLEEASRGWLEAKKALDESKKQQEELTAQIASLETDVGKRTDDVAVIAAEAYTSGGPMEFNVAVDEASLSTLMDKLSFIDQLSWQNEQQISELKATRGELAERRAKLDEEIRAAEQHEQEMAKKKKDAETALQAVNGHPSDGLDSSGKPAAAGGPGGSSCSEDDPTGGPCLTPRTLHAYNQARSQGFTRYASCNHPASYGEHPKGRACDFAASQGGFAGEAAGDDKAYGNQLAAWFVENSEALGVMYVIWFRQIWMPSTGWRNYSSGGSPSAAHTNHVHLSVV